MRARSGGFCLSLGVRLRAGRRLAAPGALMRNAEPCEFVKRGVVAFDRLVRGLEVECGHLKDSMHSMVVLSQIMILQTPA